MEREANHSRPFSADVKNEWSCNSRPPIRLRDVHRVTIITYSPVSSTSSIASLSPLSVCSFSNNYCISHSPTFPFKFFPSLRSPLASSADSHPFHRLHIHHGAPKAVLTACVTVLTACAIILTGFATVLTAGIGIRSRDLQSKILQASIFRDKGGKPAHAQSEHPGCDTVHSARWGPTFRKNLGPLCQHEM